MSGTERGPEEGRVGCALTARLPGATAHGTVGIIIGFPADTVHSSRI